MFAQVRRVAVYDSARSGIAGLAQVVDLAVICMSKLSLSLSSLSLFLFYTHTHTRTHAHIHTHAYMHIYIYVCMHRKW